MARADAVYPALVHFLNHIQVMRAVDVIAPLDVAKEYLEVYQDDAVDLINDDLSSLSKMDAFKGVVEYYSDQVFEDLESCKAWMELMAASLDVVRQNNVA